MEVDQEFFEYVLKGLVEHPEDVKVERRLDNLGVLLMFTVHPDDMGKIIGKGGKTMEALRILFRMVGMKHNERLNLKLMEPAGGKRDQELTSVDEAVDGLES